MEREKMILLNQKVFHKKFGEGIIKNIDNNLMTIIFSCDEKKFVFPFAFEKHLSIIDDNLKQEISGFLDKAKDEREQKKVIAREEGFQSYLNRVEEEKERRRNKRKRYL